MYKYTNCSVKLSNLPSFSRSSTCSKPFCSIHLCDRSKENVSCEMQNFFCKSENWTVVRIIYLSLHNWVSTFLYSGNFATSHVLLDIVFRKFLLKTVCTGTEISSLTLFLQCFNFFVWLLLATLGMVGLVYWLFY